MIIYIKTYEKKSHTRKKNNHDDLSLFSITEKVREVPKLSSKKKESKQNSTGHRSATKSKQAKQTKKQIKKKFLDAEVEKIMQKREFTSDTKLRDIKNVRTNDISGMREDLQNMKDVISKLSFQERSNKSDEKKSGEDGEVQLRCLGYRKKIGDLQEELQVQRQANAKLEEAHIQSQVFAQQTKDFSQSIKQELSELASKHIKCQQNMRDLEEAKRKIREMSMRQRQLEDDLKKCKENEEYLRGQNARKSNEVSTLQQQLSKTNKSQQQWNNKCKKYQENIAELENTCQELQQQKETISQSLLQKIKEIHSSLQTKQSENTTLKKQNQSLLALIQHLRQQLEQQSSGRTCNTEEMELISHSEIASNAGINGLDSMERKCEELYEQIKREKYKWDLLNSQSNQEKKHFEAEVGSLSSQCLALRKQLTAKESSIAQLQKSIDQMKKQKVSLMRQLENSKDVNIRLQSTEEELKKKNEVLQTEKDDLLDSLKKLSEERNDVNLKIQELHHRIGLISEVLSQQKLANQFYSTELQSYDQQCKELNAELITQRRKFEEMNKTVNQSKIEVVRAESAYKALAEQFSQQKNHFQMSLSKMEAEMNEWKLRHSSLQSQLQAQKSSHLQTYQALKQSQSKQQQFSLQITKLSETTKQSQEQIQKYSKQITLKNKTIHELKEAIRLVKDQSLLIKEEVEFYQQEYEEMNRLKEEMDNKNSEEIEKLTEMAMKQIEYMKGRLDDLYSDKVDLEHHLRKLGENNEDLLSKLNEMNPNEFVSKEQHQRTLTCHQQQLKTQLQGHKEEVSKIEEQNKQIKSQLQQKSKQLQEKDRFAKWQEDLFNERVTQLEAKFQQNTQQVGQQVNSEQLLKTISQKDQIIKNLTMKDSANEQKRIKIVNEIHSIQNKIAELAERNNQLQQENATLNATNQKYEEKLAIMTKNVHVLEEQKRLFEDESKLLHHQITQWKERESSATQKRQKQKQNLLINCQQKLNNEIIHLKNTIKDLANELTSNINKINSKNQEIQTLKLKYREIQEILKENHEILSQQRQQRQKLSHSNTQCVLAVQTHKLQISLKQKQLDNLNKEKAIMQNKYADLSSKYESLKLKYQNIEHQRQIARKQIQNQSVSLRVLRQQNKNIEKVMSDQLNQRKAIIQQLVNEKRMLYSHLQHQ